MSKKKPKTIIVDDETWQTLFVMKYKKKTKSMADLIRDMVKKAQKL